MAPRKAKPPARRGGKKGSTNTKKAVGVSEGKCGGGRTTGASVSHSGAFNSPPSTCPPAAESVPAAPLSNPSVPHAKANVAPPSLTSVVSSAVPVDRVVFDTQRPTVDAGEDITGSVGTATAPDATARFVSRQTTLADVNAQFEVTVKSIVKKHIYPYVSNAVEFNKSSGSVSQLVQFKFFFHKSKSLAFYEPHENPKSPCAIVLQHVTLPPHIHRTAWWDSMGMRCVQRKVSHLRNSSVRNTKWSIISKFLSWLLFHWVSMLTCL